MTKFAFIIHPRDTADVIRRFPAAKHIPVSAVDFVMARLRARFGFTICSNFKFARAGQEAEGYIIAVLLNGRQMMTMPVDLVRKRVFDSIVYAQNKLGVGVVGLGSFTTSVTDGGQWLAKQPQLNLAITHGDTFTVSVAQQGIEMVEEKFGIDPRRGTAAVVGAYGLIGRELCVFLAKSGFKLILIETVLEKLKLINERLVSEGISDRVISSSTNIASIVAADLIITATSHPTCLIKSEHLKKNAVIYDIAQPINVGPEVAKERPDIVKIDGDYVDIAGIDLKFPMGPPKGSTFACLVETAMMAMENDKRRHVGPIDKKFMAETVEWGKKYDFKHASLTSFGQQLI